MADASSEAECIGRDAADIQAVLSGLKTQVTEAQRKVRALERRAKQAVRAKPRGVKRGGGRGAARKPTGFARPAPVSDALLKFLGRASGEQVARTEATRAVNAHIKEHQLQSPEDARHIIPDAKLRELLGAEAAQGLTYFNLQQFMNQHFVLPSSPLLPPKNGESAT
jgi:chromatin remodeling complex protein RSC6